jgi:phosphoribosylcarboxyaminoimidazole (NCAIR) mutase
MVRVAAVGETCVRVIVRKPSGEAKLPTCAGETNPAPVIVVCTEATVSGTETFPTSVLMTDPEKVKVVVLAPVPKVTELPDVEHGAVW